MSESGRHNVASDGEEHLVRSSRSWVASWYPPGEPPEGKPWGSAGVCVTPERKVVLVSLSGDQWGFPAGRPIGSESWEDCLRRETLEEACATVRTCRLLGFYRGTDQDGPAGGTPLVRAVWRAEVEVSPWSPTFEIRFRKLVRQAELLKHLTVHRGELPLINRILREAQL